MAKKEKKISINKLESTMTDPKITVAFTEDDDICVNRVLSLQQIIQFVDDVVSSVVNKENGTYLPEVYGLAFRRAVLTYFANFNMPDSVTKMYDLLYNTRAYNIVIAEIDTQYLNEIKRAIDEKIDFELGMINSTAARETHELIDTLKNVTDQLNGMFGDVAPENIKALVDGLASVEKIDESKLAKAVLKNIGNKDGGDVNK